MQYIATGLLFIATLLGGFFVSHTNLERVGATVLMPSRGGTGTGTPATLGDVLYWNGTGYQGIATSSLNITTGNADWSTLGYPFPSDATSTVINFTGGVLSTASSTFQNLYGSGQNLTLSRIGASTYSTIQDLQNIFHSAGYVSGGAITEAGATSVSVAAGTGLIRTSNSGVATISYFDWTASSTINLATNQILYIGVEYNGGSPQVTFKTSRTWNYKTDFELGQVVYDGGDIHINNTPDAVGDHAMNMVQRMYDEMPIARDELTSGIVLSGTGTRNLQNTAGNLWVKLTKISVSASSSLTWDAYYGTDAGSWTGLATTTWDNLNYNNAGTLTRMSANRWGVHWFYIQPDTSITMVYSYDQYTSQSAAEVAAAPTQIPTLLDMGSRLFAKLVYQINSSSPTIYTLWDGGVTSGTAVSDHGSLSGLTDDDHTQYLLVNGSRALSANWALGGYNINTTGYLNATTSLLNNATISSLTLSGLTSGGLAVDSTGLVYKAATTTFSTGLTYTNGNVTCDVASGAQAGCLSSANWTTFNGKQDAITATWPQVLSAGSLTWGGISTSTTPTAGHVTYWNSSTQLSSVATGTLSATYPLSASASRFLIGGDATLSLAFGTTTSNTWASTQTFSAIAGAIDAGGATSFEVPNGASPTVDAAGEIAVDTTSDQLIYYGASKRVVTGLQYPAFSYSTSTAWTGTTTIYLGTAFVAETWNSVQCFTDTGTVNVSFYDGTNRMNLFNASTTIGTVTLSTNNTFTAGEKRMVDIGTPASTPTKVSCTVNKAITAD